MNLSKFLKIKSHPKMMVDNFSAIIIINIRREKMNKKYSVLLFDLDDTLLDFTGDEIKAIKTVLSAHNLPCSDDVIETYYGIEHWQYFEMGNITSKSVITNRLLVLLKMLEAENSEEIATEYYSLMLSSHKLIKGTLKMLRRLKALEYKMYIASNGYPEFQYKRIREAKIAGFFDGFFISEEIDRRKPTPAFFRYMFNRIPESQLSKYLLIGDAQTSDILGGKNAGIDTCWFNPKGKKGRYLPTYQIKDFEELEKIL